MNFDLNAMKASNLDEEINRIKENVWSIITLDTINEIKDTRIYKDIAVLELNKQKENLRKVSVALDNKVKKVSELEEKLKKLQEAKLIKMQLLNSIESLESNLPDVNKIESDIRELTAKKDTQINQFDTQLKELTNKLNDKIDTASVCNINKTIKITNERIKEHEDKLYYLNVEKGKLESYRYTYENNIVELDKIKNEIKEIKNEISDCTFLQSCYTTTRRWKIESFIPEFQTITNRYLTLLKCGILVSLNTMREKKTKKKDESNYTPDFSIKVLDTGGFERNFESFSDGESARIAICVGLALRDIVINKNGFGFDFLLMDQFLDGVDEAGAEEIINMLNPSKSQNMIISHNDILQRLFNEKITIVKENNISRIE